MSKTLRQCETPLNCLYFSDFNINIVQRAIRQEFKNMTGVSIDYQNTNDLFAIMRVVFVNNAGNSYEKVNEQVKFMNKMVIKTALSQIQSGVSQFMGYQKDIDNLKVPMAVPVNTSAYGTKIEPNIKFAM